MYRFALLIVEQIGYLAVISGGSNLFFQHVNACCERRAMILTRTDCLMTSVYQSKERFNAITSLAAALGRS